MAARVSTVRIAEGAQPVWTSLPRVRTHEQVIAEIENRLMAGSLKVAQIRLAIEGPAARRAADAADPEDIANLRSLVDGMRIAPTVASYVELDASFHVRLVRVASDTLAILLVAALLEALRDDVVTSLGSVDDPAATLNALTDDLAGVVDAIAARDGSRAAALTADHLASFGKAVQHSYSR